MISKKKVSEVPDKELHNNGDEDEDNFEAHGFSIHESDEAFSEGGNDLFGNEDDDDDEDDDEDDDLFGNEEEEDDEDSEKDKDKDKDGDDLNDPFGLLKEEDEFSLYSRDDKPLSNYDRDEEETL